MWLPLPSVHMPGNSFKGELPELTKEERKVSAHLKEYVNKLAIGIGDRNYRYPDKLQETADYIYDHFKKHGLSVKRQHFKFAEQDFENIEAEIKGASKPDEIIIIGAHYDSCDCPGANDNASGVAAIMELAHLMKRRVYSKTVRFVAFTNEEHFFSKNGMGSFFYAKRCKERKENIIAMYSLETIGYYTDVKGSQKFPLGLKYFYPDTGNFVAFVSNGKSKKLLKSTVKSFRKHTDFPSEGLAAPAWVKGVAWSDHHQFWKKGYSALMITDTAFFRYPHYHTLEDTPDKMDFDKTARVVSGLNRVFQNQLSPIHLKTAVDAS